MLSYFRKNIQNLQAYSSARDEFTGEAEVYLDANENPFENEVNRYPDPLQKELKNKLAKIKGVTASQILLGNGSDECIDLLIRSCCNPALDSILVLSPTYGMYKVSAVINDVGVVEIPLLESFEPDYRSITKSINENVKIIFFCSPNNPTGNRFNFENLITFIQNTRQLVVIDEAYIDFVEGHSMSSLLNQFPNLIILQTLSKAWGMASLRLGLLLAQAEFIAVLNKVKPPYNISGLTQQKVLDFLNESKMKEQVELIKKERDFLMDQLKNIKSVKQVFPSEANFILIKVNHADQLYKYLLNKKIIVRNRSNQFGCENCLRISIGTPSENKILLEELRNFN